MTVTYLLMLLVALAADLLGAPDPSPASTPTIGPATTPLNPADTASGGLPWLDFIPIGAVIALAGVVLTLWVNAARARRDALATLYGDSLGAVAEYLEGPYRILKKDGTPGTRFALTSKLSDVSTSIDHQGALLRMHAPAEVAGAFDFYVREVRREAGRQMSRAWEKAPVTTDAGINLGEGLPREKSHAARKVVLDLMQAHIHRRRYNPRSCSRYKTCVQQAQQAASDTAAANAAEDAARAAYAEVERTSAAKGTSKPVGWWHRLRRRLHGSHGG